MALFEGFPDKSEYTPVPNLLFGQVLEEIDDPLALKCFLRVLWLHCTEEGLSQRSLRGKSCCRTGRWLESYRHLASQLKPRWTGRQVLGCCCI